MDRLQSIREMADRMISSKQATANIASSLMQKTRDVARDTAESLQNSTDMQMAGWINAINRVRRPREEQVAPEVTTQMPTTPVGMPPAAAPSTSAGYDAEGISEEAAGAFDRLQEAYGRPLEVISAYRDPETNTRVGGASGSQHLHGNAFDVDVRDMSIEERIELIRLAQQAGFRGIGVYNNSLHFDVGGERAWGPSYSRDSLPAWAQGVVP